jgi:hypothetical protein
MTLEATGHAAHDFRRLLQTRLCDRQDREQPQNLRIPLFQPFLSLGCRGPEHAHLAAQQRRLEQVTHRGASGPLTE